MLPKQILGIIVFLMAIIAAQKTIANSNGFEEGRQIAESHKHDAENAIKNLNDETLKNTLDEYTDTPKETQYYGGAEQETTSIKAEALKKADNDETARLANEASKNKNKADKEFIDNAIHGGEIMQKEATDILGGLSKDLVDCSKPTVCRTEYFEKMCLSHPKEVLNYCHHTLNVREVLQQDVLHYPLMIHIDTKDHNYAGATIDLVTGTTRRPGPHDANFILYGRLPSNISCANQIIGSITSVSSSYPATRIDTFRYPDCNNLTIDIHVQGGRRISINVNIDIAVVNTRKEYIDEWNTDECASLDKFLHCEKKSEYCTIQNETRNVNGTPITRPCWKREIGYLCKDLNNKEASCEALIKSGCQQKNFKCIEEAYGNCQTYSYTYDCPLTRCIETSVICSQQGNCIDGMCINNARVPDPDFGRAVSKLSAAFETGKHYSGGLIFAGQAKECNKYALKAVDCCSDKGWLKDASSLFACGKEAIGLGKARENGQAAHVDTYQEMAYLKEVKVFCVFPSKLARIVQEQGRRDQLGLSFGDYKNPNCAGLTPEELQKIDFGKIDFSEFIADVQNNKRLPNEGMLNQTLQNKFKDWAAKGKYNEKK